MNAYELASNILAPNCVVFEEDKLLIGNMLRQQADRIAELEKRLEEIGAEANQKIRKVKRLSHAEIGKLIGKEGY